MARDLVDRCVLITGAASGIGRATALAFADAGATLVLADVEAPGLERTALLCRHLGAPVETHVVDVASEQDMGRMAADVHARHAAVDVLFNNAGVGIAGSFVGTDLASCEWAYGINVRGVLHGCHFFVPKMIARKRGGHVLNMSSGAGLAAQRQMPIYSMTKFAVVGLSEALRDELAPHGIQVTTVCPGIIDTPITRNARLAGHLSNNTRYRDRVERFYRRRAYSPERVASVIVNAARGKGGVLPVSPEAWLAYFGKRFAPELMRRLLGAHLPI